MSGKSTRHLAARSGFALRFHEALDGRTSESFAREINRTLRTVQRWRSGESEPTAAELVRIARKLDRDPGWFFESDGNHDHDPAVA